jgi:hypothetical protein
METFIAFHENAIKEIEAKEEQKRVIRYGQQIDRACSCGRHFLNQRIDQN